VRVPDVTGRKADDAARVLHEQGFGVDRRTGSPGAPSGTVVSQSPRGGTLAAEGSTVHLVVAP
jgi:beta-lactam-binding protein with PASTA domain